MYKVKWLEYETDHLHTCSAEVCNRWSLTSMPLLGALMWAAYLCTSVT